MHTPASNSGRICLLKSQLCTAHSRSWSRVAAITRMPSAPIANPSSGVPGSSSALPATSPASTSTWRSGQCHWNTSKRANSSASATVICHFQA